jgi:putative MATE family efflux protein
MGKVTAITEGSIWKQLLLYFFPILFGTFFQQLYNTADAVIVGHFVGKEALAMVGGSSAILTNLVVGFFVGLATGATVLIAQFYGAKSEKSVSRAVHTSIIFALAGSVVMTGFGILFMRPILVRMGTPSEIMDGSLLYLRIYFFGIAGSLVYNMGAGILRAVGDSRRPLYFLIASCLTNIVLDLLFVAALRMGVAGAAYATVISQLVSAGLAVGTLMREKDSYRLDPGKLRLDPYLLRRILQIGFPAGVQAVLYSLSNLVIQSAINALGTDTVAAWAAYGKIDQLFWMVINALGISVTTFVGQNYGAGKLDRVHRGTAESLVIGAFFAVALSAGIWFCGRTVFGFFTADPDVLRIGMEMLHFMCPLFILYVAIEVFSGALRGVGDSLFPMVATAIDICVLRVVWIFLAVPVHPGLRTVMFSYPLTWGLGSVVFLVYYLWFSPLRRFRKNPKPRGLRKL